jgi:hypothetical protein
MHGCVISASSDTHAMHTIQSHEGDNSEAAAWDVGDGSEAAAWDAGDVTAAGGGDAVAAAAAYDERAAIAACVAWARARVAATAAADSSSSTAATATNRSSSTSVASTYIDVTAECVAAVAAAAAGDGRARPWRVMVAPRGATAALRVHVCGARHCARLDVNDGLTVCTLTGVCYGRNVANEFDMVSTYKNGGPGATHRSYHVDVMWHQRADATARTAPKSATSISTPGYLARAKRAERARLIDAFGASTVAPPPAHGGAATADDNDDDDADAVDHNDDNDDAVLGTADPRASDAWRARFRQPAVRQQRTIVSETQYSTFVSNREARNRQVICDAIHMLVFSRQRRAIEHANATRTHASACVAVRAQLRRLARAGAPLCVPELTSIYAGTFAARHSRAGAFDYRPPRDDAAVNHWIGVIDRLYRRVERLMMVFINNTMQLVDFAIIVLYEMRRGYSIEGAVVIPRVPGLPRLPNEQDLQWLPKRYHCRKIEQKRKALLLEMLPRLPDVGVHEDDDHYSRAATLAHGTATADGRMAARLARML